MKILVLADPIENLKLNTDTGIAFTREALILGHSVHWVIASNLALMNNEVMACAQEVSPFEKGQTPTLLPESWQAVKDFDTVWIRKDPPFDESYQNICWLLEIVEKEVVVANSPSGLLKFHEKLLPFIGYEWKYFSKEDIVPSWLPLSEKGLNKALEGLPSENLISKPWRGHGGRGVKKWETTKDAKSEDLFGQLLQPFVQAVTQTGDRRAFFIEGKYKGGFTRIPKSGDFISNLAYGGSAKMAALTDREKELCKKLERFLFDQNIVFAGVDLLGEKISEINITAPTGIETFEEMGGENLRRVYIEAIEKRVSALK